MVLQQGDARIWGWASPNERIRIAFMGQTFQTQADNAGKWKQEITNLKPGGPYVMNISASNTIQLSDILIGDVWVCSGQSNMEMPVKRVRPLYEAEIATSENTFIRHFTVPYRYDFTTPQVDLAGGEWKPTNPTTVLDFSAVAWFFAQELFKVNKVPIGLINASMGGSPAEAWMSEEALRQFPAHLDEAIKYRNDQLIKRIEAADSKRNSEWYSMLWQKDAGKGKWNQPDLDDSDWKSINIPGYWSDNDSETKNGVVWFRRTINLRPDLAGKEAKLELGRIVDADSVYVNGVFVGTVSYQYPPRWYTIPSGLLKAGENSLVVRVINSAGKGGFVPDKKYELRIGSEIIDLKGTWKYKLGAGMEPMGGGTVVRWKPLGLHNGMIHPLLNYRIKGVIWYQGESNAGRPQEYRTLFPAMIQDWRNNWKQGDFPFLFVQLTNFMESKPIPGKSNWALLREAQNRTLSLPNTGMAVTIDIGEWNDIHPLNKKDVGVRLALEARRIAYGEEELVSKGPVFESMEITGNRMVLSFANIGDGLVAKGKKRPGGFAVAGESGVFQWASARIKGDKVLLKTKGIDKPVAVRYAWADNPDTANLFNKNGLPAAPFRTDKWDDK